MLHSLVFHVYINKIHGSRSKISSKNLVRQRCAEGFNSGVKWLINLTRVPFYYHFFWLCSPAQAMASSSTRFLDNTPRHATVGRTPPDE
jgi:hypothetical protein